MWVTMLGNGGFLAVPGLMLGIDCTQGYTWPERAILNVNLAENPRDD